MSELLKILSGVTSTSNGAQNGTGFDFSDAGASGSAVGVGLNTNGAPYRGDTAYLLDGASIIDPGCACYSIATVNPDMTQQVKIQAANSARTPQGPVVVNVISRSGTATFHGQGYLYARNGVLQDLRELPVRFRLRNHRGAHLPQPAHAVATPAARWSARCTRMCSRAAGSTSSTGR